MTYKTPEMIFDVFVISPNDKKYYISGRECANGLITQKRTDPEDHRTETEVSSTSWLNVEWGENEDHEELEEDEDEDEDEDYGYY